MKLHLSIVLLTIPACSDSESFTSSAPPSGYAKDSDAVATPIAPDSFPSTQTPEPSQTVSPGFGSIRGSARILRRDGFVEPQLPAVPGVSIEGEFREKYRAFDLGTVPGTPANTQYGGITQKPGVPNTFIVATQSDASLYEVDVKRDISGHIIGWKGSARKTAGPLPCAIDGGITVAPNGSLLAVGFPCGILYSVDGSGVLTAQKPVTTIGAPVGTNGGAISYIPAWHSRAGQLRYITWPDGHWMSASLANASTFDGAMFSAAGGQLPGGPEGFAYIPNGSKGFADSSLIVAEWSAGVLSVYQTSNSGDPIPDTRKVLATGLRGAEGAFFDPSTGDFLFSTWTSTNRVIVVRGFAAPAPPAAGVFAFLDSNGNGEFDAGEVQTPLEADDTFVFGSVPEKSYKVGLSVPTGYQVRMPDVREAKVLKDSTADVGVFGVGPL